MRLQLCNCTRNGVAIFNPTIESCHLQPTMSDFLSREADILGNEFSTSLHRPTASDDIDFDRAASAFPDIDIDSGDFIQSSQPPPPIVAARTSNGFSFDDFGSPPPSQNTTVKVTGDDDFDTFESEFPEIDAGQVSWHSILELDNFY